MNMTATNKEAEKPMSNEEVIEVLKDIVFGGFDRTTPKERQALDLAIKLLEERPQGEWLEDKIAFHFVCDQCGCALRKLKNEVFEGDYDYNFCPNCGAQMVKGGAT